MILLLDWETIIYHDLLAQLGEHYLDRVGVSGSSPLQIIAKSPCISRAFFIFMNCDGGSEICVGDELGTVHELERLNLSNLPAIRVFTFFVTCT